MVEINSNPQACELLFKRIERIENKLKEISDPEISSEIQDSLNEVKRIITINLGQIIVSDEAQFMVTEFHYYKGKLFEIKNNLDRSANFFGVFIAFLAQLELVSRGFISE